MAEARPWRVQRRLTLGALFAYAIGPMIDLAKDVAAIIDALGAQGSLAVGVFLGFVITALANYVAGNERRERARIELDQLKALQKQMNLKDDRINTLHKDLKKCMEERSGRHH
jgi:hypothetical protein